MALVSYGELIDEIVLMERLAHRLPLLGSAAFTRETAAPRSAQCRMRRRALAVLPSPCRWSGRAVCAIRRSPVPWLVASKRLAAGVRATMIGADLEHPWKRGGRSAENLLDTRRQRGAQVPTGDGGTHEPTRAMRLASALRLKRKPACRTQQGTG